MITRGRGYFCDHIRGAGKGGTGVSFYMYNTQTHFPDTFQGVQGGLGVYKGVHVCYTSNGNLLKESSYAS